MKFTTRLELHSQATRLFESASYEKSTQIIYGIVTLYDAPFQGTYTWDSPRNASLIYNSKGKTLRFKDWVFSASLAVTKGILVSFFSSAYWDASIRRVALPDLRPWFDFSLEVRICSYLNPNAEY